MKKKTICSVGIVIVLLVCIIVYFKPLSLSDLAGGNKQIIMVLNEYGIRNGEPYLDTVELEDMTAEKQEAVIAALGNYPYRRTLATPFSDGSMSGLGTYMLNIYVFDASSSIDGISITSSGKIVVNGKNYTMKNADRLIAELVEMME